MNDQSPATPLRPARIGWIDLTRVIAIAAVALCHAIPPVVPLTVGSIAARPFGNNIALFSAFTFGRLGVPLFLMISGYLLLDREYTPDRTKRFFTHNWLRLLIITEIWWVLYDVFLYFYRGQPFSLARGIGQALFGRMVMINHGWYLPMLLGLYLLVPVMANGLRSLPGKYLALPVAVLAAFAFGYPCVKTAVQLLGNEEIQQHFAQGVVSRQLDLGFSGGAYGLYMILGYLTKKGAFNKLKWWLLVPLTVISFAATVWYQGWCFENGVAYDTWYDCLPLAVCSVCLFLLLSRIKGSAGGAVIRWFSGLSFGVYLIHNLLRQIMVGVLTPLGWTPAAVIATTWAVSFFGAFLIAWIISRIPKVGKFLLYMK